MPTSLEEQGLIIARSHARDGVTKLFREHASEGQKSTANMPRSQCLVEAAAVFITFQFCARFKALSRATPNGTTGTVCHQRLRLLPPLLPVHALRHPLLTPV